MVDIYINMCMKAMLVRIMKNWMKAKEETDERVGGCTRVMLLLLCIYCPRSFCAEVKKPKWAEALARQSRFSPPLSLLASFPRTQP